MIAVKDARSNGAVYECSNVREQTAVTDHLVGGARQLRRDYLCLLSEMYFIPP